MKDHIAVDKRPTRGKIIYTIAVRLLKRMMKKPAIFGKEKIAADVPALFVANHLGYFAPMNLFLFTDIAFIPWVAYQITDKEICINYLEADFTRPALHIGRPASRWISVIFASACVAMMQYLQAIPVYPQNKKILTTLEKSVAALEQGRSLIIFPEIASKDKYALGQFKTGFINVAKAYFEKTHLAVNFYPVCVNKQNRRITFGDPITYDPGNIFLTEKQRIVTALHKHISEGLADR